MKILVALAALYVAFAGAMFFLQRQMQYHPDTRRIAPAEMGLADFQIVELAPADGERLVSWYAPASGDKPVIVYFQGNAGSIADRAERFRRFHDAGYGVLALGYRGYGGSSGSPTESGLLADGEAALAFLGERGIGPERIVLFGESLGSGIAVPLAVKHRVAALVLDSPFTSAADVARRQYWFLPVGLLMRDQFRSADVIGKLRSPLFVFHGTGDTIVPVALGRRLFEAAPDPKEMVELPGSGHVAAMTPELWQRLDAFLSRHAAAPSG
ncbi:MAG: alpha/beta hydrolase [Parvibaculaceae bacterium]